MTLDVNATGTGGVNKAMAQCWVRNIPEEGNKDVKVIYANVGGANEVVWAASPIQPTGAAFSGVGWDSGLGYITGSAGTTEMNDYDWTYGITVWDTTTEDPVAYVITSTSPVLAFAIQDGLGNPSTVPAQQVTIRVRFRYTHDKDLDGIPDISSHEQPGPWTDWISIGATDPREPE